MAEGIRTSGIIDRQTGYHILMPQIKALIDQETDLIANLSNMAAVLKQGFNFHWVGFYLVKGDELVLGPFQGPVACTRIAIGKGVCGTAVKKKRPILVPDVHLFPGHIACSEASRSEIVIPAIVKDKVVLVLDIDSENPGDFDQTDLENLSLLTRWIEKMFSQN
jgi:GAF domain-containing protein